MENSLSYSALFSLLNKVQKPGRYTGEEYGSFQREFQRSRNVLNVLLSYPDIYEVGMSNLSVKILYKILNEIDGISCERVFAPDYDLEEILRKTRIPIFSLESKTPIKLFDVIGFSIGYELTLTNIINILDLGGISPFKNERGGNDPIVIAGGPAVMNPLPFSQFIDFFFIGEAEEWFQGFFPELLNLKRNGAGRLEITELFKTSRYVWYEGKEGKTSRAFYSSFHFENQKAPMIVPNIKTVQDHGVVEIMRGCPNNCRFCSASFFYRPYRQKQVKTIISDVYAQVFECGYREVTLSSLSSGDFKDIERLMDLLNIRFKSFGISFSFPSLRMDSFILNLIGKLSTVRKSGLTFAVETPLENMQRSINKLVTLEKTIETLKVAKSHGWRSAKFYFMIGLPDNLLDNQNSDEAENIVSFIKKIYDETKINININIATFIPKPHTPLQWVRQIGEREALKKIVKIKSLLQGKNISIRYHSPFLSYLEGIIARGDKRVGKLFYDAFSLGARFDAWDDRVNRSLWEGVIGNADWNVEYETLRERKKNEALPWNVIEMGASQKYLGREYENYKKSIISYGCSYPCKYSCGICRKNIKVVNSSYSPSEELSGREVTGFPQVNLKKETRVIFSFEKKRYAVFFSHLNIMTIFERAFLRAGYFPKLTEGYNPKPRLEFANPLSIGIYSEEEIASIYFYGIIEPSLFIKNVNKVLPPGLNIKKAIVVHTNEVDRLTGTGNKRKQKSLMSAYWGSEFTITFHSKKIIDNTLIESLQDKCSFMKRLSEKSLKITLNANKRESIKQILKDFDRDATVVTRKRMYAKSHDGSPIPYFELYEFQANSSSFC